MILKKKIFAVIFSVGVLNQVSGVSYSKVYLQTGADVPPLQYYNYGVPGVTYAGSQVARLTAPPVGSTLPLAQPANFLPPCVSPCIPTQSVATMTNANLLAYNSPSVPIISVANDEQSSYGYSYAVYNDGPGVRGQYYLQPGYNGILGRLVAGSIAQLKETKPCNDEKNAAIKEPIQDEHGHDENAPATPHGDAPQHAEPTAHGEEQKDNSHGDEKPKEPAGHGPEEHGIAAEVKEERPPANQSQGPAAEHAENAVVKPVPPGHEHETPEQHAMHSPRDSPAEPSANSPGPIERGHENETPAEHAAHSRPIIVQSPPPGVIIANPPISYDTYSQLMRCIQAMKNAERVNSPLSYVLLPSSPC